MRIAFAGTPAVAIPTLKALMESEHELALVITQPPAARGRSKQPQPSEVASFAKENQLTLFEPDSINDETSIAFLKSLNVELIVVVAYGQLLKAETLNCIPKGWINAHFSLLPAWRGAAPVQAAIIHGDEISGVTTFQLEVGMDCGPIYGQVVTDVKTDESAGQLLERLSIIGADLVIQTLATIESGEAKPQMQIETLATYAPKLLPADGQIKWHHPALAISRHIRGFTPNPGAWTTLDGMRIEIGCAQIQIESDLEPGQLRIEKNSVLVGTGSSALKIIDVKPAGKAWMEAAAWGRGLRDHSGAFSNE